MCKPEATIFGRFSPISLIDALDVISRAEKGRSWAD
jgi:hypothetical protein